MPGESKHGIECSQFEALLSEVLDGQLSATRKEDFEAHGRTCPLCGPLFADATAGQRWLKSLEEVEPPAYLVHNILAATTGISSARLHETAPAIRTTPLGERLREWWDSIATPTFAFVRQPRFAMSFGMIFFSVSMILSAAGVTPKDFAQFIGDLRPSTIKRTYYSTQARVVKYYENIRFVYEIESRVREFKRVTAPVEPSPEQPNQNRKNNNTSGQPDEKQERNYSREENQPVLAELKNAPAPSSELRAASEPSSSSRDPEMQAQGSELEAQNALVPPAVTVTTIRRFV
jgi:hypothetical protein